jgi:hypothetical protein
MKTVPALPVVEGTVVEATRGPAWIKPMKIGTALEETGSQFLRKALLVGVPALVGSCVVWLFVQPQPFIELFWWTYLICVTMVALTHAARLVRLGWNAWQIHAPFGLMYEASSFIPAKRLGRITRWELEEEIRLRRTVRGRPLS